MAAAVRRGSLRRPQEDQTLPKIAVAPDGDLIAGYRVAVVITAAVGGIVVVGKRDRCDQTIPGNKRDPHADLCDDCLEYRTKSTSDYLIIATAHRVDESGIHSAPLPTPSE